MSELLVPLDLAPAPYILADSGFLATLAQVEEQTAALKVTDAHSAQVAASLQVKLTQAGKDLEATRISLSRPFLEAQRKIADVARGPAARIEQAKSALKTQLAAYDAEQRRLAAEAEKARQAEIRRLDEIRRKEIAAEMLRIKEAEEAAKAAMAAVPPEEVGLCLDDDEPAAPPPKTETQRALENLQHAPVVATPKPVGVAMRVTLQATVTDVGLLPDLFVERVPKLAAIRSTYCSGWSEGKSLPEVPGVRFEVKREPVAQGRRF